MFRHAAQQNGPRQVATWFGFNDGLARRIYAGSDMYLMPSQFEPCGLSQLIALRYRSVPIVRETGGLKDTVQLIMNLRAKAMASASRTTMRMICCSRFSRAFGFYRDEASWQKIVANGAKEDFSWTQFGESLSGAIQRDSVINERRQNHGSSSRNRQRQNSC